MGSKFKWIFTLLVALTMQLSFAQEKTVSGTITENNLPLPGANVIVKGTTRSTQTDIDGKYSISAKAGEVLEFSYLGMKTKTATVGASNTINISMEEDAAILGEVVVVAYGTQKKESITGSIVEIKSEQVAKVTTGNVLQGLTGKVAGVQVINNNGLPGDAPVIRFRGLGSVNGSADPLYVVDGVPYNGDITSISNQDIESMSFLKDASSAALYGNRGANGVIIITTKKGKEGKARVTLDSRVGFANRAVKEYNMIGSQKEYYETFFQVLKNTLQFGGVGMDEDAAAAAAAAGLIDGANGLGYNNYNVPNDQVIDPATGLLNPAAGNLLYDEDYEDYLFGSGQFTQTHLSVSGGSDKTNYFLSLGYEKNEGYVVNSGLEKVTSRLSLNSQISDRFKLSGTMGYTSFTQNYLDGYTGGTNYSSPFYWTRSVAPIYPVHLYDTSGNQIFNSNGNPVYDDGTGFNGTPGFPVRPYGQIQNPYATAIYDIKKYVTDNLFVSGSADVKILDGLNFVYTATADLNYANDTDMDTPLYGDAVGAGGRVQYSSRREMAVTHQQLLKYNKRFGKHGLDLLAGHETLEREIKTVLAGRSKMLFPDSPNVDHAAVIQSATQGTAEYALEGFFGKVNYDFDNKYYINASARRDASSVFAPENRWGNFYGFGAAWRISQESFLKGVSWINELKIKASYGEQGNDNLLRNTPYLTEYQLETQQDPLLPFTFNAIRDRLGNRDITWETIITTNFGFDASLFNRRLNIEAEYFIREVEDMLYNRPYSPSLAFDFKPENNGNMENVGVEVSIDANIIKTKDFEFSINLNATKFENEVTKLENNNNPNNRQTVGTTRYREEGSSAFMWYLVDYAGVNPETGAALFWMTDADTGERVTTESWTLANSNVENKITGKSAIADFYGGFGFDAKYKGFDAGVSFAFQTGGWAYDANWLSGISVDRGQNFNSSIHDTWTPDNTDASLPRVQLDDPNLYYNPSTMGLIKSDYLSLQNISVGYTFDSEVVKRFGLESLRFYGLVDNVALWSKRQGFDPRLSYDFGSDNKYSLLRTFSFGVNVQF